MSSSSLATIGIQFSIYAGFPIFTLGILGNLINFCLLFPTRLISCSFLLLISSFFNIMALLFGLLPRILSFGFGLDPSSTNIIWCKSRLFLSYVGTVGSLTCICFASIDRCLVSSRSVLWRNRSNLKTTKVNIFIAITVIIVINIPYLIFYTTIQTTTPLGTITSRCSVVNPGFVLYANYFVRPALISLLPGAILIITGLITSRNIKSIAGVQTRGTFQRTLTSMIFLQIIAVVTPVLPFAFMNIYQTITSSMAKTSYRLAQETLVLNVSNIILYISYASNFYVYFISASSYRRDFLKLFSFCFPHNYRTNRIGLTTRQDLQRNTASVMNNIRQSVL